MKIAKEQLSKTLTSGRFFGFLLSKFTCPLMKVGFPLAKNVFAKLVCNG